MVHEVRRIYLSQEEIISAFDCYRRMTPHFLPTGKIIECKPRSDGIVILVVDMPAGSSTHHVEIILKGSDVLHPVIRFCLENNIMLPKKGRKSITIENNILALDIKLDMGVEFDGFMAPMSTEHLRHLIHSE